MSHPGNLIPQITDLLLPLMTTVKERDVWLTQAYYYIEPRLFYRIQREGDPIEFVTYYIRTSMDFGCFADRSHPLSVMLDAIRRACGTDKQAQIDRLIPLCNALCSSTPPASVSAAPPATPATPLQTTATPTEQRTPTVFVSYSRQDKPFVEHLIRDLQAAGYAVWVDTTSIKSDEDWSRAISAGIDNSYAFITVVSKAANTSKWVEREYHWADQKRTKPIFVVHMEDCDLPIYLIERQATRFFPDYADGLRKLIAALPTPPGTTPTVRPVSRRAAELEYLEALRLEEWLKTIRHVEEYTTLSGHAQVSARRASGLMPTRYKHMAALLGSARTTEEAGPREQREYTDILTAIRELRRAVLLGEPGAGKTTTLWRLAKDMVETARRDPTAPLPILVRLGKWTDAEQTLTAFIRHELGTLGAYLDDLLREKRAALLLDGLNEIPVAQRRAGKDEQVQALFEANPDLTSIVSCRERDYTLDLGFDQIAITPLDAPRIREFVTRYLGAEKGEALFWRLAGSEDLRSVWRKWEGAGATLELFFGAPDIPRENPNVYGATSDADDQLWQDKVRNATGSLMVLARNPYMLMMMTDLYRENGTLPDNRGALFTQFADELIEREAQHNERMAVRAPDLLKALAKLAFTMQTRRDESDEGSAATSLPLAEVRPALLDDELLYLAGSASLLSVSGDTVRFTHQLLQEYFAATYMLQEIRAGRLRAADLWPPDQWWERTGWEEATVLLAGLLSDDCTPILDWVADANPEAAATCVQRGGAFTPPATLDRLAQRWLPRLTALTPIPSPSGRGVIHDPEPRARAAIGRALGVLNLDTRPGVCDLNIDWRHVPKGTFKMGGDPAALNKWDGGVFDIDYDFWIAAYPVTYAQYALFVADGGYTEKHRDCWTDAGWEWKGEKQNPERYWNDPKWHISNHPVVDVTWYEAYAFAAWLNKQHPSPPAPLPQVARGESASPQALQGERGETRWEVTPELERKMTEVARRLRREETASEGRLWEALRDRRLDGWKFRRQQRVGPFMLDFYCAEARLAVEIDGPIHETQREADAARQTLIEELGIRFLRLSAAQVERHLPDVLTLIRAALHPSPLVGEGPGVRGDYLIRLPTEAEWEKAARYPDGRKYPWGDEYIVGYANINETSNRVGPNYLQRTTAVGIYPQGKQPVIEAYDLSGNVWEWCLTKWADEYRHPGDNNPATNAARVVRGGSWYYDPGDARAAARSGNDPSVWLNNQGFRVVLGVRPPSLSGSDL